jgi:hypothetical protein
VLISLSSRSTLKFLIMVVDRNKSSIVKVCGDDQARICRHGIGTCSWSPCPLCDNRLLLTFKRGVLAAKRSEGL